MKRDIGALADREFDVVVVGGGVYGAAIAWDATLRGLKVALIERNDFGSGTSFNNLKTIHGGVRYLQHGDLKRIRESVRERRNLMRIAPHLVHPLPFLVPTYEGSLARSRSALRLALLVNDLASWDRNRGVREDKHLPKVIDLLAARGLGLAWARYVGDDPDRITADLVDAFAAARAGDVVFSCGGIGATPDDHTRQCAARALGRPLVLHPQARDLILERMRDVAAEQGKPYEPERDDNVHRLNMGVFPEGAQIIPNPYNKIPGFSVRPGAGAGGVHFVPGFPVMAWPMIEWVLDTHCAPAHRRVGVRERSVIVFGAMEATLTPLMLPIYRRGGYCWIVTGSTQYGRGQAEPQRVPQAMRYYRALRRQADVMFRTTPADPMPRYQVDRSFNYVDAAYHRPGPEMIVYRLKNCS